MAKKKVAATKRGQTSRSSKPKSVSRATARGKSAVRSRSAIGAPSSGAGSGVDALVAKLDPQMRALVDTMRRLIRSAAPAAEESIKWRMPVYMCNGLLCYLRPGGAYLRFGFYDQGTSLNDPDGLLEGTGKDMRHVKIRTPADIRAALFTTWVRQAAAMNAREA